MVVFIVVLMLALRQRAAASHEYIPTQGKRENANAF